MRCQFSRENSDDGDVSLDRRVVPINDTFGIWDRCCIVTERSMKMLVIK
jgi:hypothetical protein